MIGGHAKSAGEVPVLRPQIAVLGYVSEARVPLRRKPVQPFGYLALDLRAGGLSGGIGAVAGGAGGGAAATAGSATGTIAPTAGAQLTSTFGNQLVGALPNVASSAALPSTFGSNLIASLPNVASGGIGGIGAAAAGAAPTIGGVLNTTMPMPNPVPGRGGGIGGVLGDIGRGVGGFFKGMDGTVKGQLISGIGQGLLMNEELKARRKAEEREREQIAANYSNMDGLFRADAPSNAGQDPRSRFNGPVYGKVSYDAQTGRIIPRSA